MWAVEPPKHIKTSAANQNLVKKVEPTVPTLAKAIGLGGMVLLDITISKDGRVSATKVVSGHPMLIGAFVDAVTKWEYKPFVEDGHATEVVTTVEWMVKSPKHSKSEENALKEYYPTFDDCYKLIHIGNNSEAEKKCSEAVSFADQLPADRLIERSMSRTFLAHSLIGEHRVDDAIPLYAKALEIYSNVENSDRDADFAGETANLARAYFLAGELGKSDDLYNRSLAIYESAITALPSMKDNYSGRLKNTLLEYARLKRAKGDADGQKALEQRAATLQKQ